MELDDVRLDLFVCEEKARELCVKPEHLWEDYDLIKEMVEYIDSTECTPCALNKLRIWNPLIMEARAKGVDINYIFIVAPKPSEMDDINLELGVTDLQSSVYIDTSYEFRKLNPSMPIDNKYHS